jgi:hypothetical protein
MRRRLDSGRLEGRVSATTYRTYAAASSGSRSASRKNATTDTAAATPSAGTGQIRRSAIGGASATAIRPVPVDAVRTTRTAYPTATTQSATISCRRVKPYSVTART